MRLADVAKVWQQAGVSVVPIVTKNQPAVRWKPYQARVPELDELNEWWGNGHPWGIALICGSVSGGLEMTELEARALDSGALTKIANAADSLGCGEIWDRLSTGYTQSSPSGGLHMAYRITDHEVPGNEKIAREAPSLDPKTGEMVQLVRAETRGEGGYFVGAGSPGSCHPSGEPWLLASGAYGVVPSITWNERQLFHEALRLALDESPTHTGPSQAVATLDRPVPRPASPGTVGTGSNLSPGDDWSAQTDWADILVPNGWQLHSHAAGGERMWVRPGKDRRDGHSASTDYQGKPGFYVWSTSAGLETEQPLSKLFVYAHYSFGGDLKACAQYLKRRQFGSRNWTIEELSQGEFSMVEPKAEAPPRFSFDDVGNAMRLWHHAGRHRYRYVYEEKGLYAWDGVAWTPDHSGQVERDWFKITEEMEKEGIANDDKVLVKWARTCRGQARINSAISLMRVMEGATISASKLNTAPAHINLLSGTYNTNTKQQEPHNRDQMMTRTMNASYDPKATCPKFELFMEQVLPDPEVRRYVQRAVGYSLLGRADRRAFFLIYGPSGTGKSQFLSTMEYVFGNYAGTAAEGTFRVRDGGGPNNDLHGLRGKRFVSTSETAENANFNEQLLKRLTGRDQIVSREMYQTNITWTPECALWLATNHPPRFNSDDDAIWKRAKLVPFLTRFGTDMPEIPDFARAHLYAEADGILNWILAGLHDFLENGLGEPAAVVEAATQHREQSDSVIRFLEDQLSDGRLEEVAEATIRTSELFAMYEDWCRSSGERGLGNRRFMNRLESSGRVTYIRTNTQRLWKGLHRAGVLGSWETFSGKN